MRLSLIEPVEGDFLGAIVVEPGRYRHYKGKEYAVIGMAQHSETREKMVVYRPLYGEDGEHGLWVRPAAMFAENVVVDGISMPRFARLE